MKGYIRFEFTPMVNKDGREIGTQAQRAIHLVDCGNLDIIEIYRVLSVGFELDSKPQLRNALALSIITGSWPERGGEAEKTEAKKAKKERGALEEDKKAKCPYCDGITCVDSNNMECAGCEYYLIGERSGKYVN